MNRHRLACLAVAAVLSGGCSPGLILFVTGRSCCMLPQYAPPVVVYVTNAETGEPVTATVTLSDGQSSDTQSGSSVTFETSWPTDVPSTVTVTADGFVSQTIENVVVTENWQCCIYNTVYLDVELTPS